MTNSIEIQKRRTFAIISHPDAGKTTITEKLLLFGGAIQEAGAIKAKKAKKYTTSDWMELEKQRGVSVSTSVMSFEYKNYIINLLDTPGHEDFSEDTYRTLTAVDSVLMVLDSTKGVETRTLKLYDVCKMRNTPVITFMNKLDREGLNPFELLDDVEKQLGIKAIPLTWPIGMGKSFRGIYDLQHRSFLKFMQEEKKQSKPETQNIQSLTDLKNTLTELEIDRLKNDLDMIEGAIDPLSHPDYLSGKITPVFFGSAVNNFGMQELLESFIKLAPAPLSKPTHERIVNPSETKVTAFAFKIHANMDANHRDRIAFIRICSGTFFRGMKLRHVRLNREIKIANPVTFLAQNRSIVEEAYPGDIIGLHDTGIIRIGDTFTEGETLNFSGIPSFSPEIFRKVLNTNPLKHKQLTKGLEQLSEEGAVQLFRMIHDNQLILGAVGSLQFDVVKFRLENEYSANCKYETVDIGFAYWVAYDQSTDFEKFSRENKAMLAKDTEDRVVYFIRSIWTFERIKETYPTIRFYKTSECSERDRVQ